MSEQKKCGEDGTCCGSTSGCGAMDRDKPSILWFVALVVIIVLVILVGGRHGISF